MKSTRTPHPRTGRWDDVPAGEWFTAGEVARIVGITSQSVTNRFQGGKTPEGWTVRKTPAGNLYMRLPP